MISKAFKKYFEAIRNWYQFNLINLAWDIIALWKLLKMKPIRNGYGYESVLFKRKNLTPRQINIIITGVFIRYQDLILNRFNWNRNTIGTIGCEKNVDNKPSQSSSAKSESIQPDQIRIWHILKEKIKHRRLFSGRS